MRAHNNWLLPVTRARAVANEKTAISQTFDKINITIPVYRIDINL